jgi:hypothetical protein
MEILLIVIVICIALCMTSAMVSDGKANDTAAGDWLPLSLDQEQDWSFVEGAWQERGGVITAPGDDGDENVAVYTQRAFGDFEAEFDFRWDNGFTAAGFLFRAADPQHYYLLHFPAVGSRPGRNTSGPASLKSMRRATPGC